MNSEEDIINKKDLKFNKKGFKIRLILAIIIVLFLGINSAFNFLIVEDTPLCIKDTIFQITAYLNDYMNKNKDLRNICMILSSITLDAIVLITSYTWIINGKSWRPIMALVLFYSLKFICNLLFTMRYPEGMLWEYPGFPSLIISYQKSVYFFYSGYVGLNLICCIELYKLNMKIFSCLAFLELTYLTTLLLILKANYFVDIVASLYAAHYFYCISDFYCYKLNKFINLNFIEDEVRILKNSHIQIEKESPDSIESK